MKRLCKIALTLSILVSSSSLCYAQSVKVRVISTKDNKPLTGQPITVSLLYDNSQKIPSGLETTIQIKTDTNGEASFALPEPAPAHLSAQVHLTSNNWRCACMTLVPSQEVVEKGISVTSTSQSSAGRTVAVARPREIIFSPRPLTFFERLLEPFVKQ